MTEKSIELFYITVEIVTELKMAIEAAKQDKTERQLGKLSPLQSITSEQLQQRLKAADEEFENGEWFDCKASYRTIVEELKLGPTRNLGRFALSLIRTGETEKAITLAQQAYKEVPQEPSSYETLALYLNDKGRILEAMRWASLATAASGQTHRSLTSLSTDLSHQLSFCTFCRH